MHYAVCSLCSQSYHCTVHNRRSCVLYSGKVRPAVPLSPAGMFTAYTEFLNCLAETELPAAATAVVRLVERCQAMSQNTTEFWQLNSSHSANCYCYLFLYNIRGYW